MLFVEIFGFLPKYTGILGHVQNKLTSVCNLFLT